MRPFFTLLLTLVFAMTSACAQDVRRAQPASGPQAPRVSATLRPGDSFEMILSGIPNEENNFARQYTVADDGMVSIPLLPKPIRAGGLSLNDLERTIEQNFIDAKIFRHPRVTINVQTMSRHVTVGGNVRVPGRQVWSTDLTLASAVTAAGGPSEFAGDKVELIRGGKRVVHSRKRIRANPALDPKLLPGDSVELR